jgi:hypothetical protein
VSADQPGPRNWDKELADIDKLIAASPPAKIAPPSGGEGKPAPPAARGPSPVSAGPGSRRERLATWVRVGLGVLLGAAMTQWPYFHACGTALFLYLGATGVVVLSGLWGAISAWRRRMGLAHMMSLLVVLWGATLAAATVLPRIGYAKRAATWWCP